MILLVVGLGLAVCGGAGALAYFSGAIGGDDPVQVVEDFFAATRRGDCEAMADLVTESRWRSDGVSSKGEAVAECRLTMSGLDGGLQVTNQNTRLISNSGSTAVVATTLTSSAPGVDSDPAPQPVDMDIMLRKEGRHWRIDTTSMDGGPGLGAPTLPTVRP